MPRPSLCRPVLPLALLLAGCAVEPPKAPVCDGLHRRAVNLYPSVLLGALGPLGEGPPSAPSAPASTTDRPPPAKPGPGAPPPPAATAAKPPAAAPPADRPTATIPGDLR